MSQSLKEILDRLGLKQAELARLLDVIPSVIISDSRSRAAPRVSRSAMRGGLLLR